ncbi:DNA polymerase III subunit alpha [Kitasatospora sp. MBT63]|uniref:DNA polymerase III subunit alpha n=1 Tax=Kitasatospora sp. MBT63 TaxID=1444768 RepID=UPI00053AEA34|nr:DNA polymerase III subunit alpha [Kitasatospora sp. MBT63]
MFPHLHTASGYSVRYGASLPAALAERAAERGVTELALTDRDTVSGVVRHAKACAAVGVRPLFGADLAVGLVEPAAPARRRRTPVRGGAFVDESAPRITFLARNKAGWANLCALISLAWAVRGERGGGQPVVPLEVLADHTEGLTVLLGPGSEPIRALAAGRPDRAEQLLAPWRQWFGPALRLEAVHLRRPGTGPGSLRLAARTMGLATELDLEAVLTNAVRYANPGQGPVADVLDAARLLRPVQPGAVCGGERWLKAPAAMAQLADEVAEAAGQGPGGGRRLLAVTARTAAECRLDPASDLGIGGVRFPEEDRLGLVPGSSARVLRKRCESALAERGMDRDREAVRRLAEELEVATGLGWSTFFLTVARIVGDFKEAGVRVSARGSGAGSLIVHLLGISAVNPLEHGLMIMERFLSFRRRSLPDIDVDVPADRRIACYRLVLERFGTERVAAVAMPETYRVRWAIRDVALATGLSPEEAGRLAKAFPHIRARDARSAMAELPELRQVAEQADRYGDRFWDLVEGLDALPRGSAMHPCGLLLSDDSLLARTPVLPTPGDGLPMSVFDKEDVEDLGCLKLDILGNRTMQAMSYALSEIERTTGRTVDLDDPAQVPLDDEAAFALLREGESLGVFSIDSPGQRDLLGRAQPRNFLDLVVQLALFRPGPVAADMIRPWLAARHGRQPVRYPHPDLIPALSPTLGVLVFNEQVAKVISTLTRTDLAMGEEARRALSRPERLPALETWFRTRAAKAGYDQRVIDTTFEQLKGMGAYGFPASHSAAFAVITLQSAWLKAHFGPHFYAGIMQAEPGMYPLRLLLADARRHGVPVLPVCVEASEAGYRVETGPDGRDGLRIALAAVKGITAEEIDRITASRPFASVPDLWERARPSLPTAQHLARIGALAAVPGGTRPRRDLLLLLDELHHGRRTAAVPDQLALPAPAEACAPTGLPAMTPRQELDAELEVIGLDVSRHLMAEHHALLAELGVTPSTGLRDVEGGETVLVAGAKVAIQTPPQKSGKRTIFLTLDDGAGGPPVDLAFFSGPDAEAAAHTLFHSWLLVVRGQLQHRGRSLSVVGHRAWDLAELARVRAEGGTAAVRALLATPGSEHGDARHDDRGTGGGPGGAGRMWHASPGSAG